ncbi:hypothetical protein ACHAW5_002175 [Stephanodiscus triporus]|uniref:Uncharacterized protein n=1 Tax=Stephanodiscus triporus TaxID=2934178 RepID=A0ABD3P7K1_9STRA
MFTFTSRPSTKKASRVSQRRRDCHVRQAVR